MNLDISKSSHEEDKSTQEVYKRAHEEDNSSHEADKSPDKSELPEENVIVQGIIDAFFIEENEAGEKYFVLVDFKTNRIDERKKESELERLKELYRTQMQTYENALKFSNFLGEGSGQAGAEPKVEKIIYHIGTNLCIKY